MSKKDNSIQRYFADNSIQEHSDHSSSTHDLRWQINYDYSKKPHMKDYIDIIFRRKRMVISFVIATVSIVTAMVFIMKPMYKASSTVQIRKVTQNIHTFQDVFMGDKTERDFYQTQYEILRSRSLAQRVISKYHDKIEKELRTKGLLSSLISKVSSLLTTGKKPDISESKESRLVSSFIKRLEVQPVKTSQLVRIGFLSYDRTLAATLSNAVADEYISFAHESKVHPTLEAKERMKKEVESIRRKLKQSEENLNEYISKSHNIFLSEEKNYTSHVSQKLAKLFEELELATAERISKEAIYRQVQQSGVDYSAILQNPVIQSLTIEYANLESEYFNLLKVHKPEYPKMLSLKKQIDTLRDRIRDEERKIINSLDSDYKIALKKEMFLTSAIQKLRSDVADAQQDIIQLQILSKEVETNREIYNSLLQRLKELDVSAALTESYAQVLDRAEIPLQPFKPKKIRYIFLSLILGLFGGIMLAFITEYFDNSIKTIEDIEYKSDLPVIGMVPVCEVNPAKLIGSNGESDNSPFADAFKSISTFIQFKSTEKPPRQILVTSPLEKDGKTTSAINVAKSFSNLYGKGIVIDADLRRPRLHYLFGLENSEGLSTYLSGNGGHDNLIQQTSANGFDVITSGPVPKNPSKLLNSQRMKQLINSLSVKYDYVIIDSAPVLGMSDTLILSSFVESVIVVVKSSTTPQEALAHTIKSLHNVNANVLGVVLNGHDQKARYGYSYGYL